MKSLKQIFEERLAQIRGAIQTLDNLGSSAKERADAIRQIIGGDPEFWSGLEKTLRPKPATMKAEELSPREVVEMEAVTRKPVAVIPQVPLPTSAPKKPVASETSSARELDDSPRKLKNFLGGFLGGKNIHPAKTTQLVTRVFQGKYLLGNDFWEVFLPAVAKAWGNGFYILHNDANPKEVFLKAPTEELEKFLFGQEGVVVATTAQVAENKDERLPAWLCVKAGQVLDAVIALDDTARGDGLDEHTEKLVENLLEALEARNAPDWVIEKGCEIFPPSPEEECGRKMVDPKWSGNHAFAEKLGTIN
jgi:hypothetical protein